MSKFEMPMFDGIKTFDDEHGHLAKMFRAARFKKGGSSPAPSPNYTTLDQINASNGPKDYSQSSIANTVDNPYDFTYRPYPAPWSPPPPVTPPTTGGSGGAGGVGSGGVPGSGGISVPGGNVGQTPGGYNVMEPSNQPGYGFNFFGMNQAQPGINQPQPAQNLFQRAQDQVAQNQPALGSSGGLQIGPNQQWQAGLPAFTPGGPDDPAMGGTGYIGGGPVGIRGAPGMVGGSPMPQVIDDSFMFDPKSPYYNPEKAARMNAMYEPGGWLEGYDNPYSPAQKQQSKMDMVEQWKNSFNPSNIYNPYQANVTPTLPVMDQNTLAAMLKQSRKR